MTPDERLEVLLNRAGQTISDLPCPIDYNIEQEELAMKAAADFGCGLEAYILHLVDVIDRMEWALENACGELKEQEPVKPVPAIDDADDWWCGNCYQSVVGEEELDASGFVSVKFNFCPNCGRAVDWRADDE